MESKTVAEVVGGNVRVLRRAAGLSQEALAALMSEAGFTTWHRQTVNQVEAGRRAPSIEETVGLAAIFEMPLRALLIAPGGTLGDEAVEVGGQAVPVGYWTYLLTDIREPVEATPTKRSMKAIDSIVGMLDRPWARSWRKDGGKAPDAYAKARDEVLARRGRLPGPIYVTTSDTPVGRSSVFAPWGETLRFTLEPGIPYLPRDENEAEVLLGLEATGHVRRITRQQAYRLRQTKRKAK